MTGSRFALAIVIGTFGLCGAAFARTIVVDDDRAQCPEAEFNRIQPAVDAAAPRDRILVCAGTYREQVTVLAGKDFITLRSKVPWAAIIKAPEVMLEPGDIVHVSGAQGVVIDGFTITGPLPDALFCSLTSRTGVRIDGGGSAELLGNHVMEVRSASEALRGCQNGVAVLVGRTVEGQIGRASVVGNLLDSYQKAGVVVDNAGSSAFVADNRVRGIGPTPVIAQNGIQVSRGAHAFVLSNEVSDHTYSFPLAFSSTGVLLFQLAGGVTVSRNRSSRNDDNFAAFESSGLTLSRNRATDSTFYDGIFFDELTAGNRISRNVALGNKEHDCHDDSVGPGTAGTANTWRANRGQTENRPGLCGQQDDGDHGGGEDEDED
jgi:hypothetical protein